MTEQLTALELADELDRVAKWSDSEHWGTLNEAAAELRHLHEEVTEQGRLLSMSAERELSLLARIGRLEKAQKKALENIYAAKLCEFNSMSSRHEMIRLMDAAITAIAKATGEQA